jgi:Ca2+-binding EF-hand superfamily protein
LLLLLLYILKITSLSLTTKQNNRSGPVAAGGVGGAAKLVATGLASWILGASFHSGRAVKEMKRKHKGEQKKLYSQYYNDVYKLGDQNNLLQQQIEALTELVKDTESQAELEALQRDYDEFKQPDLDSDDRISRAEFNMYVKDYLSNYPGLTEKDYPKFEDFDHDGNGFVSFQEYSQQMAVQAEQAELEELYGDGSGNGAQKAQAYSDLARGAGGNKMYY